MRSERLRASLLTVAGWRKDDRRQSLSLFGGGSTFPKRARVLDRSWMVEGALQRRVVRVHNPGVGSPETFEEFFEFEHERLLRALYLVTGDREEAEDLTQEAFVKVLERWDLVRTMATPTGYVFQIAMNAFRTKYRRAVMAVRRIALLSPRSGDPFDEVEVREDVRLALAALTRRQRAAIVLTELLGYPPEEAALILSIKPSTVRVLTTQARATLRSTLRGSDE